VRTAAWSLLESLFTESRLYRGDNSIRLVDLNAILGAIVEKGQLASPDTDIHKDGGSFSCHYQFDPKIWGKWFGSQDLALSMAAMDKDVVAQYAGRSQGHTVHKTNWGGRVVNSPGKPRGDFERMPSAMDRYDVLMQGDITSRTKRNKKTGGLEEVPVGDLLRIAYSPSIGSTEDRKARLLAFMSGEAAPDLSRRPQPHVPEPDRLSTAKAIDTPAPPVPRVGQNLKRSKADSDDDEAEAALSALSKKGK
jgi:hypothetical protein